MSAGGMESDAYTSDEMSMRDYWALVRRRKWYVILPVLAALGASLALSLSTTPVYRSSADVLVEVAPVPGQVSTETAMNDATLRNELSRAQGAALQEETRQGIGDEPRLSVTLADEQESDLFVFTAESRSARRAADSANAYAETYVESRKAELAARFEQDAQVRRQQIEVAKGRLAELTDENADEAAELRLQIADLRGQIDALETAARSAEETGATIINLAEVSESPDSPRPVMSAALAVALGLIVGLILAFLRDFTDNHIRTPERLEQATGLPTTAVIPRLKGWKKSETHVVVLEDPTTPQAESYRALRARIQFRRVDRPIRSMVITSPRPGEGKTTTSANLAVAFASAGEKTVLVDLDMRRPRVHKFFPLKNDHGMSTVLAGGDLDSAIRPLPTVPNLSVVPAGQPTTEQSELLREDRLTAVLNVLKSRFDIVIIDTPPVLAVADPLTIAHHCDGTIVVVSASGTDSRDAELAVQQLAQVGVPPIGAILNNYSASETGYSYSYAYSEYAPTEKVKAGKRRSDIELADISDARASAVAAEPVQASPVAPKLSRRQLRKLAKNSAKAHKHIGAAEEALATGVERPSLHSTQAIDLVASTLATAPPQPPQRVEPPLPLPATPEVPPPVTAPSHVESVVQPEPEYNIATPDFAPHSNEVVPTLEDSGKTPLEDSSGRLSDTAVVEKIDRRAADVPNYEAVPDSDVVEVMTAVEVQEYLRSELRQAREEHVPFPLANAIGLQDLPDESTARLDRPVTEEIDHLGQEPSTNGDHSEADENEAEVMSAEEFQEYLRSELRRAREEHSAGGSTNGAIQTIKVVLMAEEAPESGQESGTKSSAAKKSAAKKSAAKKSAAKKSAAKKSSPKKARAKKTGATKAAGNVPSAE